jgi:hypothetical protein
MRHAIIGREIEFDFISHYLIARLHRLTLARTVGALQRSGLGA